MTLLRAIVVYLAGLAATVLAIYVVFSGSIWLSNLGSPSDEKRVEVYCAYGSVSEAQEQGCVDHVTIEDVRKLNTPAAKFALSFE